MLKRWLSQYRLRYPRSLVYMLQASEYHVRDYLSWYHKVKNFGTVEHRKHFIRTGKSVLLLVIAWLILIGLYAATISLALLGSSPFQYLFFPLGILLIPTILAYAIVVPLVLIRMFIQRPIEYFIIKEAKEWVKNHPGLKIGIAGSFGKTSMREILKTVLMEGKHVVAPPHSYNTLLGMSQFVKTLTGNEDIIIFELGEYYPGDIRKLCAIAQPDIGIITGINEAHLQKFKTLDQTIKTIYELADYLGEKPLYVNGDSALAVQGLRKGNITYSQAGVDHWKVEAPTSNLTGTSFVMRHGNQKLDLKSQLLGLHQVGPLAVAAFIALQLGLSHKQVQASIAKTKPFDHRLEPKTDSSGVITLDDSYNGNPDGVKAVIAFLRGLDGQRRLYVTPGLVEMGKKTQEVHRVIGQQLADAGIEKVILIRNSVTPFIEQGLKEANFQCDILWFDDALAAFAALPHLTVAGDIVLLQNDWPDQYQ